MESLPDTVDVTIGDTQYTGTPVEWSMDEQNSRARRLCARRCDSDRKSDRAEQRIYGYGIQLSSLTCILCGHCATGTDNPSEIYDRFAEGADELLNMVSDQAYGNDGGINWGYTSTPGASGAGDSQDMGSHTPGSFYDSGWWATSSGTIDYSFELEPGNYAVMTGYQEWWSSTRGH